MTIPANIKARLTVGMVAVLLYYLAWRLGVLLIHLDHDVEGFSARFFFTLFDVRWYIVAAACVYSAVRRFALEPRQWDIYGPILAVLAALLIYLEIQKYV